MKIASMLVLACSVVPGASTDEQLMEIRDGFETRREAAFEELRGRPLMIAAKRGPIEPGRGAYTVHFSYSITDFAMRALWLNEQIDTANQALETYCKHYIDDRLCRNDRDSFYWAADVVCRIVEFFGRGGSIAAGRLDERTEDWILEMMWVYARENSKVDSLDDVYAVYADWRWGRMGEAPLPVSAETARSRTWDVIESENHHMMKFSTLWHFAKLLSLSPKYTDMRYDDGHTPAEHYAAWTKYAREYCRQRARKGLFVEMADDSYNAHTIKGLYNMHDFAEDRRLRELAGNLLTLYYASWAQEQIAGVRGGGKSRMNGGKDRRSLTTISAAMWYYVGMGRESAPRGELFTIITSAYRLPLVIMDLVLDVEGRGSYEVMDRAPGLAQRGFFTNPHYQLRTDYGGIVRYSYCTPDFIMGLPMVEARPFEDWTLISSQSRWLGVIFAGDSNARIFPQCRPEQANASFNQQWGVQRRGTLIAQRLSPENTRGAEHTRVWLSNSGLDNRIERDGWVFVEAPRAYAAVRPARGGYTWTASQTAPRSGQWMTFEDGFSPVIIEVARKRDFENYQAFMDAVMVLPISWQSQTLHYAGLSGDAFVFHADYSDIPRINGKPFDYAPENTFHGPFVQSRWDSGRVTITKGNRGLVLDMSDEEAREREP